MLPKDKEDESDRAGKIISEIIRARWKRSEKKLEKGA
jgi:hypothetical protein